MHYWSPPYDLMFSQYYKKLEHLVIQFLLSECKHLNWTIHIDDVLITYSTLFELDGSSYWEDIANCERKAEYLHTLAKGNRDVVFARSVFHNRVIGYRCTESNIQNKHENRWLSSDEQLD